MEAATCLTCQEEDSAACLGISELQRMASRQRVVLCDCVGPQELWSRSPKVWCSMA